MKGILLSARFFIPVLAVGLFIATLLTGYHIANSAPRFEPRSNFNQDSCTNALNTHTGRPSLNPLLRGLWANDQDEIDNLVGSSGESSISGLRDDFAISGSCSLTATSTSGESNYSIEFGFSPTTNNRDLWRGYVVVTPLVSGLGGVTSYVNGASISINSNGYTLQIEDRSNAWNEYRTLIASLTGTYAYGGYPVLTTSTGPKSELGGNFESFYIQMDASGGGGSGSDTVPTDGSCDANNIPLCGNSEVQAEFLTRAVIRINSVSYTESFSGYPALTDLRFFDRSMTDGTWNYTAQGISDGETVCTQEARIAILDSYDGDWASLGATVDATLRLPVISQGGGCAVQETSITISNPIHTGAARKSRVSFVLTSDNTIRRADAESGDEWTFVLNSGQALDEVLPDTYFVRTDSSELCKPYISRTSNTVVRYIDSEQADPDINDRYDTATTCRTITQAQENAMARAQRDGGSRFPSGVHYITDDPNAAPGLNANAGAAVDAGEDNSCESNSGPLGWIMCPIAGILDAVTGWLDQQVESLLMVKDSFFDPKPNDQLGRSGLEVVWTQIRNLAYVILIPIMLIMVIGTALGFEVFSAYTVKKALPRMVIAIIFITLSWYICRFMIDLTNSIGLGIRGLITSPFQDMHADGVPSSLKGALHLAGITRPGDQGIFSGIAEGAAVVGVGLVAVAGGIFTQQLTLGIIMSTLGTAALVLGIVFLLLVARQMILLALFLVAPLAILSWIFPGNDKLWKFWWNAFSKLLMMFPLIMLIIGVGQVFALTIGISRGTSGDSQLLTAIMIIAAIIIPYALIPFTFKWAGGLFANLAGMVNDKERGVLDRLKKGRAEAREKGWSQATARPKARIAGMRYKAARGAMTWAGKDGRGRVGSFLGKRAADAVGGDYGDWEAANSARNAEEAKRLDAEKATGNDAQIRGSTADLALINSIRAKGDSATKAERAAIGTLAQSEIEDARAAVSAGSASDEQKAIVQAADNAHARVNNGQRQVRSLSGAWVNEADAEAGHKRFKGNRAAQQFALQYELSKAKSSDEVKRATDGYHNVATGQWGMSGDEAKWAWTGAAYATQGQHLELKHSKLSTKTGKMELDKEKYVEELYETKGSYQFSQMNAHSMEALHDAWRKGDDTQKAKVADIINTFKMRGMGSVQAVGEDGGEPIQGVSSQGSASFDKALQALERDINPGAGPASPTPTPPTPGTFNGPDGLPRQVGSGGGVILTPPNDKNKKT